MALRFVLSGALAAVARGLDAEVLLQSGASVLSGAEGELDATSEDKYPVAGGLDWPFQTGRGPPDVYVHWVPTVKRSFEPWVYHPATFTMGRAFSELGANVMWTDEKDLSQLRRNVTKAVEMGRKPILIALAFWSKKATDATKSFLADFSKAGGYLVLYQSENMAWVGEKHLPLVDRAAAAFGAKEIWEYSLASMDYYKRAGWGKLPIRYLPPGYVKELDFNVSVDGPLRDETRIAFLGRYEARDPATREGYSKQVGDILFVQEASIQTRSALIDYVARYPLQLNNHHAQDCCPSHNAVESFRFSQLVANKACIISAMCLPVEMKEWEGIVHFVDIPDTRRKILEVKQDLKRCQADAYRLFRERFAPSRLLRNSGFDRVFLQMAPHLRG